MGRSFTYLMTLCLMGSFVVGGCSERKMLPGLAAEVGLQAVFRQAGRDLLLEVIAVDGPILRTEVTDGSEIISIRDYYRGLLPIAGTDGDRHFSFDFDTHNLDALFPLTVGNTVSFRGTLALEGAARPLGIVVQASVTGRKTLTLKHDHFDVMIVVVEQIYRGPQGVRRWTDTFYHAPSLSLNLKSVTRSNSHRTYWYATDIKRNGLTVPTNARRPGSVMI